MRESELQALALLIGIEDSIPKGAREQILAQDVLGLRNLMLMTSDASADGKLSVYRGDVDALVALGFVRCRAIDHSAMALDVTASGQAHYRSTLQAKSDGVAAVAAHAHKYLDADEFVRAHPRAHEKWNDANTLLASASSPSSVTTIGHLCREALQCFADSLSTLTIGGATAPLPATVARLKTVLKALKVGDAEQAFLSALLQYWGTVADLAQRQEHGAAKEGDSLGVEDARRAVFHTLIVMYEWDRACRRPGALPRAS